MNNTVMFYKHSSVGKTELPPTVEKKKAIIVDIDNTFCETEFILDEIEKLGLTGSKKWEYFNENVNRCMVNDWCVMLVNNYLALGYEIVFLTARSQEIQKTTLDFIMPYLKNYLYKYNVSLYMREKDDISPAWEIKRKWLEQLQYIFFFLFAIDDDIENCLMYKSFGIPALCPINSEKQIENLKIHYALQKIS